ncbi:MAG: hypothetical protein MUE33_02315 [Cytophagaceae bacterium]|nr:hypothetical protein [Cytophagaceae bacterium]
MKYLIVFLTALMLVASSCSQHLCPTYANSGAKYHHHAPHPYHSHH